MAPRNTNTNSEEGKNPLDNPAGGNTTDGGTNAGGAGSTAPAAAQQTPRNKPETVEIPKSTLETILTTLEDLKKSDAAKTKTIERLEATADKGRLSHYDGKEAKDATLITRAKVGFFEGRPIVAWHKGVDEVGFRDGRLVTKQTIIIFLHNGEGEEPEQKELEYLYWAQNTSTQEGEVTGKNQTKDGNFWTVEMNDGQKITLDIRFINPF